jgi:uncharacterized protein with gpF-like domain
MKILRPNAGIRQRYQRQLLTLIDDMNVSILYWVKAQYRDSPPILAMDAKLTPSQDMQKRFQELAKKWKKRWEDAAPKIAESYLKNSYKYTNSSMMAALRESGISVRFEMTPAVRDKLNAKLTENVALIKSIPEQYLSQVEGSVMRAYSSGFNLQKMIAEIVTHTGVTQRRAANIAFDQTNKAHTVIAQARSLELGFTEAEWIHSGGGRHPRAPHMAAGRERRRYQISEGCPIKNEKGEIEYIQPGEKPFCRCVFRVVIPYRS